MADSLNPFPDMIHERAFNGGKGDNNGLAKEHQIAFNKVVMALPASPGSCQPRLRYRILRARVTMAPPSTEIESARTYFCK
jgi:hypothetical protein